MICFNSLVKVVSELTANEIFLPIVITSWLDFCLIEDMLVAQRSLIA